MEENNKVHLLTSKMTTLFLTFFSLMAFETADALQLDDDDTVAAIKYFTSDEGQQRSFSISNISLVITYTTVIVAALMLAGFLWMAFAYSGQGSSNYGRKKREAFTVDDEMAAKLHWINESFRKYQIDDLGCQLYIACEAGKMERKDAKVGRITTMIHSLIAPIELDHVDKLPKEVKRLFLAYQEGAMLEESCASLYSAICPLITRKKL